MAITDLISAISLPGFLNLQFIGYGAASIIVIVIIVWALISFRQRRNLYGESTEREVEKEVELDSFWRFFRGGVKISSYLLGGGIAAYKKVWTKAKSLRGSGSVESAAEEGAAMGAKASVDAEKAAQALEAVKGRALGLIAGLKLIEESIEKYVKRAQSEEDNEDKEVESIDKLGEEIGKLSSYKNIDANVLAYLKQLMEALVGRVRNEMAAKKREEAGTADLLQSLKLAIFELKRVLREARKEQRVFKRFERKARKDYSADINDLKSALNKRYKELKKAKKAGKNADSSMISRLKSEITMMYKQYKSAQALNGQLKVTFKMMDIETRNSRRIVRNLLKYGRRISKVNGKLSKTEKELKKRVGQMEVHFRELESSVRSFESTGDMHALALSFSGSLNIFLKEMEKIDLVFVNFDRILKETISVGYEMARLTEAYEGLIEALTNAEETVNQGMEVLIRIMQSVVSDSEVKVDEQEVAENLERLNRLLDKQRQVDDYLKKLAASVRYKIGSLYSMIDAVSNKELEISALLERYSGYLGHIMGVAFNRMLEIDQKYMGQVDTFQRTLQQRNQVAYAGFKEARAA